MEEQQQGKVAIQTQTKQQNEVRAHLRRNVTASNLLSPFADLKIFLLGIVLLALFLRLAVVAFLIHDAASQAININDFGWESWEMGWVARSIFLGHGFSSPFLPLNTGPTALVPPLYPYFLAGVFKLLGLYTLKSAFAVLSFNSICSALTCLPLYLLTRNALSERAGRIAAFGWAVYPFAIYFSADRVWDYALTALLFSCCLLVAQRLHLRGSLAWAGFGLLYGLAVLSNPSIVSLLPVLLLIAMFKVWRVGGSWFTKGLIASLAFIAVCTPWTIRNQRVMHASFFMRDGFWLEFYAGNNGDTHESNSAFAHPASNPAEMVKYQQMGEIAYMASNHDLAVAFVKHHPGFFAIATARRVVRFWTGFWSFSPSYLKYEPFDLPNVPFCLVLIWAMQRGIRRWWREDAGSLLPYLCALVIFPLPYYLTHASMDYRQPLEPMIIVLVTVGFFGTGADRQPEPDETAFELQDENEPVLA